MIPKLGIKQTYIEGQGYTGDKLIYGETARSKKNLPAVNKKLVNANRKYFDDINAFSDSVIFAKEMLSRDTIRNSFFSKTLILYSPGDLTLAGHSIEGNIIIVSETSI